MSRRLTLMRNALADKSRFCLVRIYSRNPTNARTRLTMTTTLRIALLAVLVAVATPGFAEGQQASSEKLAQRVELLELKVSDLEQRIRGLEALIKSEHSGARPMPTASSWRDLANWRQLRRGMPTDQARALLGDPDRVDTNGPITTWTWGSLEASLQFYDEKLDGWSEPRR